MLCVQELPKSILCPPFTPIAIGIMTLIIIVALLGLTPFFSFTCVTAWDVPSHTIGSNNTGRLTVSDSVGGMDIVRISMIHRACTDTAAQAWCSGMIVIADRIIGSGISFIRFIRVPCGVSRVLCNGFDGVLGIVPMRVLTDRPVRARDWGITR